MDGATDGAHLSSINPLLCRGVFVFKVYTSHTKSTSTVYSIICHKFIYVKLLWQQGNDMKYVKDTGVT